MSITYTITKQIKYKEDNEMENAKESELSEIKLQLKPKKSVTWTEETVDNEHMNKLKSKICCVYHRPRLNPDDPSTDESCSSCDEKGKNRYERPNHYEKLDKNKHNHKHNCNHNHDKEEKKIK